MDTQAAQNSPHSVGRATRPWRLAEYFASGARLGMAASALTRPLGQWRLPGSEFLFLAMFWRLPLHVSLLAVFIGSG